MKSIAGYGANAVGLAAQYESLSFADVHIDVLHLFPETPCDVLDIGAGSGRDAAALAKQGHKVTAVEPTIELMQEGKRIHANSPILWINDALPELSEIRTAGPTFDVILLTAVWMHLNGRQREEAMAAISELLRAGGKVFMSLRHGPIPEGRCMYDVSVEETTKLGQRYGLSTVYCASRGDMLGRTEVSWSFIVLQANHAATKVPKTPRI